MSSVNRMTDACENITLPQTSFAGGENGSNYRFTIKTNDFWSNLTTAELKLKDQYLKRAMADGSDNCAN